MLHCRSHDIDYLNGIDQGLHGGETTHTQFLLHSFGRSRIRVIEADQFITTGLTDALEMDLSQMPSTQNTYFQHNGKFGQK